MAETRPPLPAAALPTTLGLAHLARLAYAGADLASLHDELLDRAREEGQDGSAVMDLSMLVQMQGRAEAGLKVQALALDVARAFQTPHGTPETLRVLALMAPGDFMANTPIDFLLEGSGVTLVSLYLDPQAQDPLALTPPAHDVALLAVGESPQARPLLARLEGRLAGPSGAWPRPVVNAHAERIARLDREGGAALLEGAPGIVAPPVRRLSRAALQAQAGALNYPVLVRPVGSHAGQDLAKVDDAQGLAEALARHDHADLYVTDFVDYADADGLYRKQRVVFVDGAPFIVHMAVSSSWMVHYLSAEMAQRPERREEEAAFMAAFDTGFAVRHRGAFAALCERVGLDYFGVDCAQAPDGRLLVFELDVAMIVHALDDPVTYPYKVAPIRRLFAAVTQLLHTRAAGAAA